ncbi:MAG: PEP-utilizing enzyme [Candidatus Paceibacterota bacterium]
MEKAEKYMFLEHVPGGHPMDVVFVNLGHMMLTQRPEFGVQDQGSMVLIFHEGSYKLFIEKDKWFDAGQKVLDYTLASDERIEDWEGRMNEWLEYIEALNSAHKKLNFEQLTNRSLCIALDSIIGFEKTNGMQVADIITINYGTNLIHKTLEKTLKDIGFSPHAIAPILFRTTRKLGVIEYDNAISEVARKAGKESISELNEDVLGKNPEIKEKIHEIQDSYGWLDASLTNPPKSVETIIRDINDLLSFGSDLERILKEREEDKQEKKDERQRVFEGVMEKADPDQQRVITFATKSAEVGSVLVDETMRFLYLRRGVFEEFGKRLAVSETEAKYLWPEELKDNLMKRSKVSKDVIRDRMELTVCVLENEEPTFYTGSEAKEIEHELNKIIVADDTPMQGEIAYSKGKVIGIARLVQDVGQMDKVNEGDILVSSRTYPDLLPAMKRSKAIIAELGGLLSHAAIVSRELQIPCLVGVQNATSKIKDGDEIEVDTEAGTITVVSSQ